jgi:2-methylcitrate dehydratase PrpD
MAEAATAQNPYTRRIAEFISQLKYEDIPDSVRERLKLLILDSLGCAIYGAHVQWCRILRETLEQVDQTRATSIWGTDRRLSSPHAALVNGTQVQSFELDDVHREGILHVGAVTLPALIAVTQTHAQLSGRDVITAAVAGYEIGRASGSAWDRSISARAGIPAPPSACSQPPLPPRAGSRSIPRKRCMHSASPARNPAA